MKFCVLKFMIKYSVSQSLPLFVQVLLDNGGDVNRPLNATFSRATPLMIAAQNGDLEMVKLLVSRKAKIEMLGNVKRYGLKSFTKCVTNFLYCYFHNNIFNSHFTIICRQVEKDCSDICMHRRKC